MDKGVSPLLATILLVVFTVGIAGIVSIFFGDILSKTAEKTEESGDTLVDCSTGSMSFADDDVRYDLGKLSMNVTANNIGQIDLYNITVALDVDGVAYTYSPTEATKKNSSSPWKPGRPAFFTANMTAANLTSRWTLNESSGTVANDYIGTNSGTADSSASRITGVRGQALSRNGSSALITITSAASINFTVVDNFTLATWFYLSNEPSGDDNSSRIFAKGTTNQNPFGIDVTNPQTNPRLRFGTRVNSSTTITTYTTTLQYDRWYHVAFVHTNINSTSGNFKGYVDGVQVVNTDHSRLFGNGVSYVLGGSGTLSGNTQNYRGGIDDSMIFNRSLSADEVLAMYNSYPSGTLNAVTLVSATCPNNIMKRVEI